jgi:hypothetical protein
LKNNWNFFFVVDALAEINYRNKSFSLCLGQEQNNTLLLYLSLEVCCVLPIERRELQGLAP